MLKPSLRNTPLFWLLKYFVFYIVMMFKNNNYALIRLNNLRTFDGAFFYFWTFLFLPAVCTVVFLGPFYLLFKSKNITISVVIMVGMLVIEYVLYTYLASQENLWNGLINAELSVVFFYLMFFKSLSKLSIGNSNG